MAGPAAGSPATVVVLLENGCLLIGEVGGDSARRCSPRRVQGSGGLGGEAGEGVVRGVLRLSAGVRLIVVVGLSVTGSEVWGW